jgi:hypothetical protein
MSTEQKKIVAIVTVDKNKVSPGAPPVFYASNKEEQRNTALLISRVTGAMAHDLENGVWILVKH